MINKQGVCRVSTEGVGGEEKDMKSGGNKILGYGESIDFCMTLVFTLAGISIYFGWVSSLFMFS